MNDVFWMWFVFGAGGTLGIIRISGTRSAREYIYCGLFTAAFYTVLPVIFVGRSSEVEVVANLALGASLGAALMTIFKIATRKPRRR